MKKQNTFLSVFIVFVILNMVAFPEIYIKQTFDGISAWALNVLPSILPFIFFTKVLSSLGIVEKFTKLFEKPMNKCFKTPAVSGYVFFMSIISGYPVGAKMTADLVAEGKISRADAFKITSFCSTSGPMFILGAVGIGMLKGGVYGYIILLSHILGAFLNGFLYRKLKAKELTKNFVENRKETSIASMIEDSCTSVLTVGAIIAVFFVIIRSLDPVFSLFPASISCVLEGLVEITKGCIDISKTLSSFWATVCSTFVISFGGFSTILQSMAMLNKIKMPVSLFTLQKLTHAIISTITALLLCCVIL